MFFLSFGFYIFLIATLFCYYITPYRFRWYVLLFASSALYLYLAKEAAFLFGAMILISYFSALRLGSQTSRPHQKRKPARLLLFLSIAATAAPLVFIKSSTLFSSFLSFSQNQWLVPLGISFFTLQMIAYLVDVAQGKISPEQNFLKYVLFISFFPQILQGPIPRYTQLAPQLFQGNRFNEIVFTKGLHHILWGFFLKLMIADKAAIMVNTIFNDPVTYYGAYIIVGGILYTIQLYADFSACFQMASGIAGLFGITLPPNFLRPYHATSIKEFWGRWHISLSQWLRDYIYIPLGGSRAGYVRKYCALTITFLVSGFWHGNGVQYLVWGGIHVFYQICGALTAPLREGGYRLLQIPPNSLTKKIIQCTTTFCLLVPTWIIFRAETLSTGMQMLNSAFHTDNLAVLFDQSLFTLGLNQNECFILLFSILCLFFMSAAQEKMAISDWVLSQHLLLRWSIYLVALFSILTFGTYGFGFNAQDFIYGGF